MQNHFRNSRQARKPMKSAAVAGFLGLVLAGVTVSGDSARQSATNANQDVRGLAEGAMPEPITPTTSTQSERKQDLQLAEGEFRQAASFEKRFALVLLADSAWMDAALFLLPALGGETVALHSSAIGKLPRRDGLPGIASQLDDIARAQSGITITVAVSPSDQVKTGRDITSATGSRRGSPARASNFENADLRSGVPSQFLALIEHCAEETGVDERWMLAILHAENAAFDAAAVSRAGAIGLMQVKPLVGRHYGAKDLTDPEQNIWAAARFLKDLFTKYGNPVMVAAAYNAGEPRIDARAGLPLIPETVDYVSRVTSYYYTGRATTTQSQQHPLQVASLADDRSPPNSTNLAQPFPLVTAVSPTGKRNRGPMSRLDRIKETSVVINSVE